MRISESHKGKTHSEITKKLISEKLMGRNKYNHSGIAAMAEKKKGRPTWNKGLTKETNASVAVISEKHKGKHPNEATRKRMSESHKGIASRKKGFKQSEYTKKLISEKHKGLPAWNKGGTSWSKGLTKETNTSVASAAEKHRGRTKYNDANIALGAKKRMGRIGWSKGLTKETHAGIAIQANKKIGRTKETHIGIALGAAKRTGEKSYNWCGGISFEPYSPTFNETLKKIIRQRDGYKCQECGVPQSECIRALTIHHVDYSKKNSNPYNLITLCVPCNGRANHNRSYWKKHYKAKIRQKKLQTVTTWFNNQVSLLTHFYPIHKI